MPDALGLAGVGTITILQASGTLPITKRLGEKGPEDDLGGEDVVLTKQRVLFAEDALDPPRDQDIREGQPVGLEEWFREHHIRSYYVYDVWLQRS